MVGSVSAAGCAAGVLQTGDVLLAIDGHPIASDSFVELEGERVQMGEVVERKFRGDDVKLHILRDKKESDVTVKLDRAWPFTMQANAYDVKPRYVLFGGLLFQPLSRDFTEATNPDDLRVRFFYDFFISDEIYLRHPEVIVLSGILPDRINTYLGDFRNSIVDEVNGAKIRTLNDLADAFGKPAEQYVIKVLGTGRPIVLEHAAVEAARERIMSRYNVRNEKNLGDTTN
jgi:hypothetical protein